MSGSAAEHSTGPTRVIATWIYLDQPGEESEFPQVGGKSSTLAFQKVYWRCILTFFITSSVFNCSERHILYTNSLAIPSYPELPVREILNRLGVEIIQAPLTFKVPRGYWGSWNNQFYVFDVVKTAAGDASIGSLVLLDSDCVWVAPAHDLFDHVEKCGLLAYDLAHEMTDGRQMNGLSLEGMTSLYAEAGFHDVSAHYYGGEFFAATHERMAELVPRAEKAFETQLVRFADGQSKFNEEAQLLSYLYQTGPSYCGDGGKFISRVWSHIRRHRQVEAYRDDLTIIHMPVEKKHGIPRLLRELLQLQPHERTPERVRRAIVRHFSLPNRTPLKDLMDLIDKVKEKLGVLS